MEEILNLALLMSDDEDDDIDDLLIDHILDDREVLGPRARLYWRFDLENMLETECIGLFRFSKEHIPRLARSLDIPESVTTVDGVTISRNNALCVLLRRLAYPNRLVDLEPIFGYSSEVLSNIFNSTLDIIAENKSYLLENLTNNKVVAPVVDQFTVIDHFFFNALT